MNTAGDPAVQAHLANAGTLYAQAGVIEYLRDVVRTTWRDNLRRWSPDRYFDDWNTLGHQTSRNVTNRILKTIETSDASGRVLVTPELGVAILAIADYRLRVIKAPIESGLTPDFDSDFDWSTSTTRDSAARRNASHYFPLASDEMMLEFENDPRPEHLRRIESCRDVFLLWAADLTSDRTAGWLGLPRVGETPWLGIQDLWLDDAESAEDLRPSHDGAVPDAYDDDDED